MISIFILVALGGEVLLKPLHNNVTLSLSIKAKTTIALQVMNGSSGPIEVWSCGFWPNHQMTLVDTKGIPVPMTALGKIGAKRFGDPNRDKNVRVKIAAGKSYGYETPPLAVPCSPFEEHS